MKENTHLGNVHKWRPTFLGIFGPPPSLIRFCPLSAHAPISWYPFWPYVFWTKGNHFEVSWVTWLTTQRFTANGGHLRTEELLSPGHALIKEAQRGDSLVIMKIVEVTTSEKVAQHFNPELFKPKLQPWSFQPRLFNHELFNHELFNYEHFNHELFSHELFKHKLFNHELQVWRVRSDVVGLICAWSAKNLRGMFSPVLPNLLKSSWLKSLWLMSSWFKCSWLRHLGLKIPGLKHGVLAQNVLQPSEKDKKSKKKEKIVTPKTIAVVENFKLKVAVLPDSINKIMTKSIEKVTTQSKFPVFH